MDVSDSEEDNNVVHDSVAILYSDAINAANMLISFRIYLGIYLI